MRPNLIEVDDDSGTRGLRARQRPVLACVTVMAMQTASVERLAVEPSVSWRVRYGSSQDDLRAGASRRAHAIHERPNAGCCRLRAVKPTMPAPASNKSHVSGSGTGADTAT